MLAWCATARAERAVVECIADTWVTRGDTVVHGREPSLLLSPRGAVLLQFRGTAVEGWQLKHVVLLIHLNGEKVPDRMRAGPVKTAWKEAEATWNSISRMKSSWRRVRTFEEDWIAIDLDPREALGPGVVLSGPDARFHSRESSGFAPYLLVEGTPPPK